VELDEDGNPIVPDDNAPKKDTQADYLKRVIEAWKP
jgi:hypothetical protein